MNVCSGVRALGTIIRDRRHELQRPRADGRVRRRVHLAPRAVRHPGETRRDRAVHHPDGANTPVNGPREGRHAVEGVELSLVDCVRPRCDDLADIREPHVVARGARHRGPSRQTRLRRENRRGKGVPGNVEAERRRPSRDAARCPRADPSVDGVRIAAHPRKGHRNRDRRRLEGCRVQHRAVFECRRLRELELVACSAAHRHPRK